MMKLVQTLTAATNTASFTFSNIPQTAQDLAVYYHCRDTDTFAAIRTIFNGITEGSNYESSRIFHFGTSISSSNGQISGLSMSSSSYSASAFGSGFVYITGYSRSGRPKAISGESYGENFGSAVFGGLVVQRLITSNDPITSITFAPNTSQGLPGGAFAAGSTFSLYTIG